MSWDEFVKDLDLKEGLVAGAALASVILIGLWLWADHAAELLELVTAIGTMGAVVVALAFGLRDIQSRKFERQRTQVIVRWVIASEIGDLAGTMAAVLKTLQVLKEVPRGQFMPNADLTYLARLAQQIQVPACSSVLDKIDTMEYMHSFAVAAIIGKVPLYKNKMLWLAELTLPMSERIRENIVSYEKSAQGILENVYDSGFIKRPSV